MNDIAFYEMSFCKKYLCLLGEGLWYKILVPSRRRTLVLEIYVFHEKGFYKRGGEEYWDVFMGSKIVEFHNERV